MNNVTADEDVRNLLTIYSRLDASHKRLVQILVNGVLVLQNNGQSPTGDCGLTNGILELRQTDPADRKMTDSQ